MSSVNNIPLGKYADQVLLSLLFNTLRKNANGVKELVFAGMLLAARDIIGGANWTKGQTENPDVTAAAEKEKRSLPVQSFSEKLGIIGLWCDRREK